MFALLRNGDKRGAYRSRSEVIQAIALAAVNAGLGDEWLWKVLTRLGNRAGEKVREIQQQRGEAAARRYVSRSYVKARGFAFDHPLPRISGKAEELLGPIARAAGRHEFRAHFKRHPIDQAVLAALLGIARMLGRLEFDVSGRRLCELTIVSRRSTINKSLRRLEELGFLVTVAEPTEDTARVFRLRSPKAQSSQPMMGGCEMNGALSFVSPHADVWFGRKGKWRIWTVLEGKATSEIAQQAEISVRAAQQHLHELEVWGLAVRDSARRWHRIENPLALDKAASQLGVLGKGAELRERHVRERHEFRSARRVVLVPESK